MARQPQFPLPLPKNWPRRVRSAAVHAIALAQLALTTARGQTGTTLAGAGLPPAGTTSLSRHTWTTTPTPVGLFISKILAITALFYARKLLVGQLYPKVLLDVDRDKLSQPLTQ